ncbi:MAG: hypothetical protein AB7P52_18135 [Alphaproteobacteria bacterium]
MPDWLAFLLTLAAAAAAVFGYLAYQRAGGRAPSGSGEEAERLRRLGEDQARTLRQEIGESLRPIEARLAALEARMPRAAHHDAGAGGLGAGHELLRQEIAREGHRLTEALFKSMIELRAAQAAEAAVLSRGLAEARELIRSNAATTTPAEAAGLQDALTGGLERIEKRLTESLGQLGVQQVGRLEQVSQALQGLCEVLEKDRRTAPREASNAGNGEEPAKRLKELEAENARLRVAVAELTQARTNGRERGPHAK